MRTTLTLFALLLVLAGSAQTQQGSWNVSGFSQFTPALFPVSGLEFTPNRFGFGFFTEMTTIENSFGTQESEVDYFGFNISPEVGYFVIDNLQVGLHGLLLYTRGKNKEFDVTTSTRIIGLGPVVRYYIPTAGSLKPSIGGSYTLGWLNSSYEDNSIDESDQSSLNGFSVGLGADYFFTPNVSLGARLDYQRTTNEDDDDDSFVSETTIGGVGLRVGLQVFFGAGESE